jgi:phosphoesterase RecJ-like protein
MTETTSADLTDRTALDIVTSIADAIRSRRRFLLTSHARPDGDSIGLHLVNADAAPDHYREFPGVDRIEIAGTSDAEADALIVMECSDLARTGVRFGASHYIINIDHHVGNRMYGALNWFDESASACGEMVFDVIQALGVPFDIEIATHIYLAILTDTGSFHHSNITPRTFDICRQAVEAGVNPAAMARRVFDSNSLGKLKLIGTLLDRMELVDEGRLAVLYLDDQMLGLCGCTHNDTEGVINLPLTAREVQAVVFFKVDASGDVRVSMRSKYDVNVRNVATLYGGGGHKNASGFSVPGALATVKPTILQQLVAAIAEGLKTRPNAEG